MEEKEHLSAKIAKSQKSNHRRLPEGQQITTNSWSQWQLSMGTSSDLQGYRPKVSDSITQTHTHTHVHTITVSHTCTVGTHTLILLYYRVLAHPQLHRRRYLSHPSPSQRHVSPSPRPLSSLTSPSSCPHVVLASFLGSLT